jgi:bifunctional DNA-binding transcriptional regulator/antitoxin component of YhaV-PrlF toxin-antitoxin module
MNHQGRVSIPAQFRHELGFTPETDLVSYVENGRVVLEARDHLIRRIQQEVIGARETSGSVVDELIKQRRTEAEHERAEMGDQAG